MKFKKLLFAVLLAMGFTSAMAQPQTTTETVFNPHWYVRAQAGGQYTLGEVDFGDLISPNAQIAAGYNFTSVWGLRLGINAWQSKGGSTVYRTNSANEWAPNEFTWKYKYVAPTLDATINLTNLFGGFNAKRLCDVTFFAGVGANIAFSNDEAADAFTALGDYKDSKDRAAEAVQLRDESRKNNPYLRITDYILANGKESEVEGFAGKTLRYDALGAEASQFTTYLGADPANPELIYVLQKYLGPEEQFKELQFNMNLDGQSLKYELTIPLKREYDALIFKESGTVAMATYNYGDIITYDTIDDTELKKENVVDFVDRQDIKELPTSYVNNLVSVLNIAIYDYDFGVTMQELGFEKLDAVSKEKYEELKENYLKSNN